MQATTVVMVGLVAAMGGAPTGAGASVYPETPESRRAIEANREEARRIVANRAEKLARVETALRVTDDSAVRDGSVPLLIDIAADPAAGKGHRDQAAALLARAAAHPDPAVALRAERALEALRQLAARPQGTVSQTEEDAQTKERHREKLRSLMNQLADPASRHRGQVASTLAMLAAVWPAAEPDLRDFSYWMQRDPDAEVARWGEVLAARFEGRVPDPQLVPPYIPSDEELRLAREREEALIEQATGPDTRRRYGALRQLSEIALGEDRRSDPEFVAVFTRALQDPDSRVSSYARFMLTGLAGDRHALGMVYVRGESRP